jgi:hypothetical protein
MRKLIAVLAVLVVAVLTGCSSDADVASFNLGKAAEQFEINRRIIFFNGITDTYIMTIEGKCSVETTDSALGDSLEVTCKVDDEENEDSYKKHFLGLSDNVSFFVEQLEGVNVSAYHYRVIFKPETIIPDVDRP